MAIQITPDQVPAVWEAIKYGCAQSDNVTAEHRQVYLNSLLFQLLSGKAQCFVRLNKERELQAICITKVTVSEMTGEKALFIRNVYSYDKVSIDEWIKDFEQLVTFGKREGCKTIYGWTTNDQIAKLAEAFKMSELTRSYGLHI